MSRIRSQLDTILAGNGAGQVTAPAQAPKPAFEPLAAPVQQAAPAVQAPPQPRQQYTPQPPAPNRDLQVLQQSLEQLSQRINAIPKQPVPSIQQNQADLQNSQAALMNEIKNGYERVSRDIASQQGAATQNLESDLKRISDGIAMLQSSSSVHPDYVDQMQAELGNLNIGLNQLINTPPSQIDLSGVSRSIETGYSDIVNKLDQVLSERGPEMPTITVPDYSDQFVSLNERLEEVTRAVVSMTVSPNNNQDQHSFERIEARLASLSKAVDDISVSNDTAAVNFAQPMNDEISDTIAAQIAHLSEKLDNVGIMGDVGSNIFADVQGIATRLDTLQNEFGVLASNLDRSISEPAPIEPIDLGSIEHHLAELANRMDAMASQPSENPNTSSQEILQVLRDLVGRVESIEQIANQEAGPAREDAQLVNLEQQLSSIAAQLGNLEPSGQSVTTDLTPITERLDHIEGQIATSRDIVLDIATEAAQKAAAAGGDNHHDGTAFASILEEIRQLREAQHAVPQSTADSQQLGEISSAISSIAERLADIENQGSMQFAAAPIAEQSYEQTPAQSYAAPYEPPVVASSFNRPEPQAEEMVSEMGLDTLVTPQHQEPMAQVEEAPSLDMANFSSDSDLENGSNLGKELPVEPVQDLADGEDVPLAPGSAMPDLEALVRNATQRKKGAAAQSETAEDIGSTSDLLAAARKAARMASQEANNIAEKPAKKTLKTPSLPSINAPAFLNKKVLMMSAAVVAIAVGGFTLAPKILGTNAPTNMSANQTKQPLTQEQTLSSEVKVDDASTTENGVRMVEETTSAQKGSALLSSEPVGNSAPKAFEESDNDTVTASLESIESEQQTAVDTTPEIIVSDIPQEIGNGALIAAMADGDGNALFEAARRYTDGDGVERNLENALIWYRKAAEAGNVPAQYRIGNFYEKGHGVTADQAEAAKWYSKAAAQGNALSIHNLAVLNARGQINGEPDMTTAVGWFEKAANLGVKDSQVNLGILYTKGMGVEEDLESAYKWFAVAAKGGDNDAVKKRDTVAQALRPEQLEKARGAAELWKPAKINAEANIAKVKQEWKDETSTPRKQLSKAELIKETQILLTKAGFDAGAPDGQFGNKTKNAIIGFQKKMGMNADGKITKDLIEALIKVEA